MALTTEHIRASEPISPATFPQPGSHRWGLWWLAVLAALAAGTTRVVTLVIADNTNQVADHALVAVGDAKDHAGFGVGGGWVGPGTSQY